MFDKDLFFSICEKYDVEFSQTADSPILREGRTMTKTEIWKEVERLKAIATLDDFFSGKYEWELGVDIYRMMTDDIYIYLDDTINKIKLIGFPVRINYDDKTIIKLWKEVE